MITRLRRYLLFGVGFTLPIQGFALSLPALRMTPSKAATAMLLGVAAISFATGRKRNPDQTTPWIGMLAVTYGLSSIQGFLRGVPATPLFQEAGTFYGLLVYYLLLGYVVLKREDLTTTLWGFALGGLTSSGASVLGFTAPSELDRYSGLGAGPNMFGIDMNVVIPASIALYVSTRARWRKLLLATVVGFAVGGILLSLSRTAFVAGLTMWGMWMFRSRRLDTLKYAFPAVLLLALVLALAPTKVTDRFATMVDPDRRARDGSIQGRLSQIGLGARAIASSPLIGIGVLAYPVWANSQPDVSGIKHVIHNAYLRTAVDQGLLGFIPFVMILFFSWRQYGGAYRMTRARRSLKDPILTELSGYAMFMQLALLGGIVAGFFAHPQKSKATWLVLALAPVVYNLVRVRVEELRAAQPAPLEDAPLLRRLPGDLPAWSR